MTETIVGIARQPFGTHLWGFTCRACGFAQIGVVDRASAEEHAAMHRCAPSQPEPSRASASELAGSAPASPSAAPTSGGASDA